MSKPEEADQRPDTPHYESATGGWGSLKGVGRILADQKPTFGAIRTLMRKDITAVRRSKSITIPMVLVPVVLLVILPVVLGNIAKSVDPGAALSSPLVKDLLGAIADLPQRQQLPVLVLQLLLSPLLAGRGEVDVVLTADGRAANTVRVSLK